MPNVCLDRSQIQWVSWHPLLARHKDREDGFHLSCVSSLRPCAMHFDVAYVSGIHVGVSDNALEHGSLVALMGPGNRLCLAGVIGVRACDDTKDGVVVRFCILEALEDNSANGICSAIATSTIVEGIAVTFKMSLA